MTTKLFSHWSWKRLPRWSKALTLNLLWRSEHFEGLGTERHNFKKKNYTNMGLYCPASYYYYTYYKKKKKKTRSWAYILSACFLWVMQHISMWLCLISSCKSKLPGLERRQNWPQGPWCKQFGSLNTSINNCTQVHNQSNPLQKKQKPFWHRV